MSQQICSMSLMGYFDQYSHQVAGSRSHITNPMYHMGSDIFGADNSSYLDSRWWTEGWHTIGDIKRPPYESDEDLGTPADREYLRQLVEDIIDESMKDKEDLKEYIGNQFDPPNDGKKYK